MLDAGLGTLSDLQVELEEVEEDMDTIFFTNTISNHIGTSPYLKSKQDVASIQKLDSILQVRD